MKTSDKNEKMAGSFRQKAGIFRMLVIFPFLLGCIENKSRNKEIVKDTVSIAAKSETYQEIGFFGNIKKVQWNEFIVAVQNNVTNSRKEPGNLSFSLYQPENGSLQPIWFERFENKNAHNEHMKQDYFKNAMEVIQKSLEGEAKSIYLKELSEIPATNPKLSKTPEKTRHIIVLFKIKPEKRQSFINAISKAALQSRKSARNLEFNLYQFENDPYQFVLIEGWENIGYHQTQLKQDYIKRLNRETKDFFVANPMDNRWLVKDISLKKNH